jgi:hypothetical protein
MKKYVLLVIGILIICGIETSALSGINLKTTFQGFSNEEYDMIIISPNLFSTALQPLIDHKNSRNVKTILMTTEEIYNSYPGRDKPEQIKYFIKNALDTWGITYVMLVGGANQIPGRYTNIYFEYDYQDEWNFLSDLYYADIYDEDMIFSSWDTNENDLFAEYNWFGRYDELDLYPDVQLGRLACVNNNEVDICVNKIITYETEKAYSQYWFRNVVYMGGDSLPGDEEQVDEGEYVNNKVIEILDNFTADRIWASNGRLYQSSNINAAINNGAGFVFFNGHGHTHVWATHPHESYNWIPIGQYTNSHVSSLSNGNKLPIVISDACYHCQFDVASDCFGWNFITNPEGGAIAYLGGTDIDVSYGGVDIITKGIERLCLLISTNYMEGDTTFGELWSNGISSYINDDMDEIDYITVEEFQPFGDPSLVIAGEVNPPLKPTIDGPNTGRVGEEYCWTFQSSDPDNDDIKFIIKWGDGNSNETDCIPSGESVTLCHIYSDQGTYIIKVKAKECTEDGLESDWGFLEMNIPRSRMFINKFNLLLFMHINDFFTKLKILIQ